LLDVFFFISEEEASADLGLDFSWELL